MTERTIRVGIFGAGHIVNQRYLTGYKEIPNAEVVAIADVVEGRAARLADKWGVPRHFTDYRQMLALPEIDAVHICTPPFTHAETAIAAFAAGKHVYVEKPPALSADEVRRMVAAGRAAGKLLMMGSNAAYYQEPQALKRLIAQGELGEVYFAKILGFSRRGAPHGWFREKAKAGGGPLMDGVSHSMDIFLFVMGTPKPVSVVGRTYDRFNLDPGETNRYLAADIAEGAADVPASDVEDLAVGFVQFEGGLTLTIDTSWKINLEMAGGTYLAGTKAGARLGWGGLEIFRDVDGQPTSEAVKLADEDKSHVQAIRHFVECVREGRETDSPGERSIVTMTIFDALYRSAAEGGRQVIV
jgi:predicted dehydrogenase